MSVSARTFQLLYIARQRALKDLPTTLSDFSAFIAERRAEAPQTYDRAYISPSSIQDILDRMCSPMENLLTHDHANSRFEFEFRGSQMADLMDGIDGCSSAFIDGYKEHVVQAVLEQRARLGQPRANQREIAASANISLDSARRGLQILMENRVVVEYATGRVQTYALVAPPAVTAPAAVVATTASQDILVDLAGISDDPAKVTVIPETLVGLNEDDLLPESPVPLGAVLQDGGPDVEVRAELKLVADPDVWTPVLVDGANPPADAGDDEVTRAQVEVELKGLFEGEAKKSVFEEEAEEEPGAPFRRYSWKDVNDFVQADIIVQAKACDMSLSEYLGYLAQMAAIRFRKSLSPGEDMRLKALVDKVLFPPPQRTHKRQEAPEV